MVHIMYVIYSNICMWTMIATPKKTETCFQDGICFLSISGFATFFYDLFWVCGNICTVYIYIYTYVYIYIFISCNLGSFP